jgi:hypothetical protein
MSKIWVWVLGMDGGHLEFVLLWAIAVGGAVRSGVSVGPRDSPQRGLKRLKPLARKASVPGLRSRRNGNALVHPIKNCYRVVVLSACFL